MTQGVSDTGKLSVVALASLKADILALGLNEWPKR
jgi:hypothetical protein